MTSFFQLVAVSKVRYFSSQRSILECFDFKLITFDNVYYCGI